MAASILAQIREHRGMFYVYVLSRPDGVPFYVGFGKRKRIFQHEQQAKAGERGHKCNVIRKILNAGGVVGKLIEGFHGTRDEAAAAETALIAKIGRRDLGLGPLVNLTAGGDGARDPSPEARARRADEMREYWKNPESRRRVSESLNRFWAGNSERRAEVCAWLHSPEARRKSAEARRGVKRGPAKKKVPRTTEWKRRISESLTGNPKHGCHRPEVRAKISATKKGRTFENHHTRRPEWKAHCGANHGRARPVEIDGQRYEAKFLACEALGITIGALDHWLKVGKNGARFI